MVGIFCTHCYYPHLIPQGRVCHFPLNLTLWGRLSHLPRTPETLGPLNGGAPINSTHSLSTSPHQASSAPGKPKPSLPRCQGPGLPDLLSRRNTDAEGKSLASATSLTSKDNFPSSAKPHGGLVR